MAFQLTGRMVWVVSSADPDTFKDISVNFPAANDAEATQIAQTMLNDMRLGCIDNKPDRIEATLIEVRNICTFDFEEAQPARPAIPAKEAVPAGFRITKS